MLTCRIGPKFLIMILSFGIFKTSFSLTWRQWIAGLFSVVHLPAMN
ncbi:Uncharacterized protein dnm_014280 [Desulfonema magnum]|uniref:Uncharacterized protein n=1 Tax=Desulfonema magnum TaxID=45655 RepID=A0A975BHQ3_9BACT|nr:Uncharacterized protein dnm_014280 [Desulfonema magnum]